jgi:hypothetical protein
MMLELFTRSPQKSAKQCARETAGISGSSLQRVLKRAKQKVYIPSLLHAMTEGDPDRRVKFSEWFEHKVHEGAKVFGLMKQHLS